MFKKLALAIALFFSSLLFPSPLGNPALPSLLQEGFFIPDRCWSNPQLGFIGDFLIQKRLRPCRQSENLGLHKASLSGLSEIGVIAWSIRERFNFQIDLGSGQFNWQWKQIDRNVSGQSKGGLIWNGDGKLIILEVKDTTFAIDAQAGGWDWMRGSATSNGIALSKKTRSKLRYWQVGIAVTQKISLFSPYLGITVNRTRFKVTQLITGNGHMHSRHYLGPFGGCSMSNGNDFLINVEWRSLFEEGLSLSAQIRF